MGSRWDEHPTNDRGPSADRSGASTTPSGLAAAELDLLRHAPDYDAEEMATVRPIGGWPAAAPTIEAAAPPRPSWLPPNRIEPPPRASAPVETAPRPAGEGLRGEAAPAALWFPEERTMALMAEDLLGRSLDEPAAAIAAPGSFGSTLPAGTGAGSSGAGADVWEAAMPLLAEG